MVVTCLFYAPCNAQNHTNTTVYAMQVIHSPLKNCTSTVYSVDTNTGETHALYNFTRPCSPPSLFELRKVWWADCIQNVLFMAFMLSLFIMLVLAAMPNHPPPDPEAAKFMENALFYIPLIFIASTIGLIGWHEICIYFNFYMDNITISQN
jgi:hypothetical protein